MSLGERAREQQPRTRLITTEQRSSEGIMGSWPHRGSGTGVGDWMWVGNRMGGLAESLGEGEKRGVCGRVGGGGGGDGKGYRPDTIVFRPAPASSG